MTGMGDAVHLMLKGRRSMRSRKTKLVFRPLALAVLVTLGMSSPLRAQDRGYLGINLQCDSCQQQRQGDVVVWSFSSPPKITWVRDGGPAAKAGLKEGDIILAVQGLDITTEEGGRLFGGMRAGVATEFRVRRADREATVIVTPGTPVEAFGEQYAVVMFPGKLDSVKVQLRMLYEGQLQLQIALKQAERLLASAEVEAQRTSSEAQRQLALEQRAQIDSMRRQLQKWQKQIRVQADSLAARTLYVLPRAAPEVEVVVTSPAEARTITLYSNAVAGARFEELDEDSPLVSDLSGVEGGLLIVKVVESTPAYGAGLRQGDVVLAVSGAPVRTVRELRKVLRETGEAEITYVRKGKKLTCKIGSK